MFRKEVKIRKKQSQDTLMRTYNGYLRINLAIPSYVVTKPTLQCFRAVSVWMRETNPKNDKVWKTTTLRLSVKTMLQEMQEAVLKNWLSKLRKLLMQGILRHARLIRFLMPGAKPAIYWWTEFECSEKLQKLYTLTSPNLKCFMQRINLTTSNSVGIYFVETVDAHSD